MRVSFGTARADAADKNQSSQAEPASPSVSCAGRQVSVSCVSRPAAGTRQSSANLARNPPLAYLSRGGRCGVQHAHVCLPGRPKVASKFYGKIWPNSINLAARFCCGYACKARRACELQVGSFWLLGRPFANSGEVRNGASWLFVERLGRSWRNNDKQTQ